MSAPKQEHSSSAGLDTLSGLASKIGEGVNGEAEPDMDGLIQQDEPSLAAKVVTLEDRVLALEKGMTELLMRRDSGEHPKVASGE